MSGQDSEQSLFAEITTNGYVFHSDTLELKKTIIKQMFQTSDTMFNKIKIVQQRTLGTNQEFYYILITDKNNTIKIAKWLNLIGNKLYMNNKISEGSLFEQSFIACRGTDECSPQVFQDSDGTRKWGCNKDLKCYDPDATNIPCSVIKSIIEFN